MAAAVLAIACYGLFITWVLNKVLGLSKRGKK